MNFSVQVKLKFVIRTNNLYNRSNKTLFTKLGTILMHRQYQCSVIKYKTFMSIRLKNGGKDEVHRAIPQFCARYK
jgi:hypothetical protein